MKTQTPWAEGAAAVRAGWAAEMDGQGARRPARRQSCSSTLMHARRASQAGSPRLPGDAKAACRAAACSLPNAAG
eukprot:334888-Chlamydomonas_euryale.AAC.3